MQTRTDSAHPRSCGATLPVALGFIALVLTACADVTAPTDHFSPEHLSTMAVTASAVAVSGGDAVLIAAPGSLVESGPLASDTEMWVFAERSNVTLAAALDVDATAPGTYSQGNLPGTSQIAAGTVVNSYFVHVDRVTPGTLDGTITFDEDIIGIIGTGPLLKDSDGVLGSPVVATYAVGAFRRFFEQEDFAIISQDRRRIRVHGLVNAINLDQLRVITAGAVVDSDGDGVPDDQDAFPNSNVNPTVAVGGCDAGVGNQLLANGATFNDLIAGAAAGAKNRGAFVSAVSALADVWKDAGLISGEDKGAITSCAARSE